jgi:hypothetical protein
MFGAGGALSRRVHIGPFIGQRFQPSATGTHTLYLYGDVDCEGGTSGGFATFGAVDVIGTK